MNRIPLLLLCVFCLNGMKAQEPKFIQHELGNTYADFPVNVMLQDREGMIWMGTDGKSPNLKPGDRVDVEITGIGTLSNPFVAEP